MEELLGFAPPATSRWSWWTRPGNVLAITARLAACFSCVCWSNAGWHTISSVSEEPYIFFFFGAENSRIIAQELDHYQELRGYLIQTPTYCGNSFYHCVSKVLKLQIIKEMNFAWQPGMFIYMCTHTHITEKTFQETILTPSHIYQSIQPLLISSIVF